MMRIPTHINCDHIYKALQSNDLSECVEAAMKMLKDINGLIIVNKKVKCAPLSIHHAVVGKRAFYSNEYQEALREYNAALMYAPKNSDGMRLAYYGRAELLLKTEQFSSCLKDIETCLTTNCPAEMANKLNKMKEEALKNVHKENKIFKYSSFADRFFNIPECNPDIPCFSSDLQIIIEENQPKVVASRDIPVGKVVAKETAYVSALNRVNRFNACHYCLKLSLNLIPCDNCCAVLFCDINCKEKSIKDGHDIECQIMDFFTVVNMAYTSAIRAVIKMRKTCESWDEFISASQDTVANKKKSSLDIFDNDKFSLLHSYKDQHFVYGKMFNDCILSANAIYYLDKVTGFLPNNPGERKSALRAISRILMYLLVNCPPSVTTQCAYIINDTVQIMDVPNLNYFPFIGKLNHSCVPNTYMATMGNSTALVTTMPVKRGNELTVSYINHWIEEDPELHCKHAEKLYFMSKIACDCRICNNDEILYNQPLSQQQDMVFLNFILRHASSYTSMEPMLLYSDIKPAYDNVCKTLHLLKDVPYSKQYVTVFEQFIGCLLQIMVLNFRNCVFTRSLHCDSDIDI